MTCSKWPQVGLHRGLLQRGQSLGTWVAHSTNKAAGAPKGLVTSLKWQMCLNLFRQTTKQ